MIREKLYTETAKAFQSRMSHISRFVDLRYASEDKYYDEKSKHNIPLTEEELESCKNFWNQFFIEGSELISYRMLEGYKVFEKDSNKLQYYIPDGFWYGIIDEYYANPMRSESIDDKNLYDILFHDIHRAETIFRKVGNVFYDKDYVEISKEDAIAKCLHNKQVVIKNTFGSFGGHGVHFIDAEKNSVAEIEKLFDDKLNMANSKSSPRKEIQLIAQSVVKQHHTLSAINDTSINTIRIMTLLFNGEVKVLSSVLRMGVNGSKVDNASSGGIVVGINPDGTLKDFAVNCKADIFYTHPNGTNFAGVQLEGYDKAVELCKKLQNRFASVSKLISWDIAIDENGEPLLIEMNIAFGELDFHQMCNGPILGTELIKEVLADVINNSTTLRFILEARV